MRSLPQQSVLEVPNLNKVIFFARFIQRFSLVFGSGRGAARLLAAFLPLLSTLLLFGWHLENSINVWGRRRYDKMYRKIVTQGPSKGKVCMSIQLLQPAIFVFVDVSKRRNVKVGLEGKSRNDMIDVCQRCKYELFLILRPCGDLQL